MVKPKTEVTTDELVLCSVCDGREMRSLFEGKDGRLARPGNRNIVPCYFCGGTGRMIRRTKTTYFRLPEKLAPSQEGHLAVAPAGGVAQPDPVPCPDGHYFDTESEVDA